MGKPIVIFASTPPPAHGQSWMVAAGLEALQEKSEQFRVYHINARFSKNMEEIGVHSIRKTFRVFRYLYQALKLRLKLENPVLYYVPGPVKWSAVVRDWLLLACLRVFYKEVIFHWHAIGQGEWAHGSKRLSLPGPERIDFLSRKISKFVLREPAKSLIVCEASNRDALAIESADVIVVPNGTNAGEVDLEKKIPRKANGHLRLLFLSHGTREKGLFDFIDALNLLYKNSPKEDLFKLKVVIAGDIEENARSEFDSRVSSLVNEYGDYLEIDEIGYVSGAKKAGCYANTDLFIAPSRWESFGLTVADAMAWELLIVAAASDGVKGILCDGYPYLFPPSNVDLFAQKLKAACLNVDSQEVIDLKKQLRSRYEENFTMQKFSNAFVNSMSSYRYRVDAKKAKRESQFLEQQVDKKKAIGEYKIVQVFNRYLERGGEEIWVERFEELLKDKLSIDTLYFESSSWLAADAPHRVLQAGLIWDNKASRNKLRNEVSEKKPNILVFHNVLPVGSFGLYDKPAKMGLPVVQYIHNFRPFSPSGTLWIKNRVNSSALKGNMMPEIWQRAWEGSILKTGLLAFHLWRFCNSRRFDQITHWIAVSDFMRRKFIEAGIAEENISTLRHCWPLQSDGMQKEEGDYYLFLGRLVTEKGVRTLLKAWAQLEEKLGSNCPRLVVAGTGRDAEWVKKTSKKLNCVEYVNFVEGEEKEKLLSHCRALLVPSIWWEPLGLTVYEAYDYSRPVIAAKSGGLEETVQHGVTGLQHAPNDVDSLTNAVLKMEKLGPEKRAQMGQTGHEWLVKEASPEEWKRRLEKILAKLA